MSIDELCALPVETLAEKDCLLFLWATFPQLPEALRLIKAWGFTFIRATASPIRHRPVFPMRPCIRTAYAG